MTPFSILFGRLVERRLLRDGEADASLLPGAFTTLAASTFVSGLLIDSLPPREIALIIVLIVFVWSFLKAFLQTQELEAQAIERAVLAPLPIAPFQLLAARAMVIGIVLLLGALDLALPAAVMLGITASWSVALWLILAALFAAAFGLGIAQLLRRLLTKVLSADALIAWEGPIQLLTALGILVLVVVAPDHQFSTLLDGPLRFAPPLAFVVPIAAPSLAASGLFALGAVATLVLLWSVIVSAESAKPTATVRRSRSQPGVVRWLARQIGDPTERAGFEFCVAQIRSDRVFRTRVFPLFAFPFAAILLAYLKPEDATMIPMACFGTTVYLVLAQVFYVYSEDDSGPRWLESLPFSAIGSFRVGCEKAYLLMLVLPVYVALTLGTTSLALLQGSPGRALWIVVLNAMACLASSFIVLLGFERSKALPFSLPNRGLYSEDISGGAFVALLLSVVAALAIVPMLGKPAVLLVEAVILGLMIQAAFIWKRRRWNAMAIQPNLE